jgi:hypothetical protein
VTDRRAYHAAWRLAHRDDQHRQDAARYAAHREEILKERRTYWRTAAGMLNSARHNAKARNA